MNKFLKRVYSSVPEVYIATFVAAKMMEAKGSASDWLEEIYSQGFQRGFMVGLREAENGYMRKVSFN